GRLTSDGEIVKRPDELGRARRGARLTTLANEPRVRSIASENDRASIEFTAEEIRLRASFVGLGFLTPSWELAAWTGKSQAEDLAIRVVVDADSVTAPLARTLAALAAMSALVLVPSALAVLLLSRRFAAPIKDLRNAVQTIARQHGTRVRASIRGAPELQDLS